jgi:pantoate--beta-alanine ligase
MSSRNVRLSLLERQKAANLFKTLSYIKENIQLEDLENLKQKAQATLIEKGFKVEYVAISKVQTLETIQNWDGKSTLVALVAAYINQVRLIDNLVLN